MVESTFMISINMTDDRVNHEELRAFIRTSADFTSWWNHIPALFLIETRLSAEDVAKQIERYTNKARFLVMKVDPESSQGWLPERAWQWISRRSSSVEINHDLSGSN